MNRAYHSGLLLMNAFKGMIGFGLLYKPANDGLIKNHNDNSLNLMYIGHALIQAISSTGITQDELAHRLKVHPGVINQLCRGNRQASDELVSQLAAALDCEVKVTVQFVKKPPEQKSDRS